jgi:catechol 2,3-dioxygenase-like lactoylglutathione lyase family enzyme
MADPVLGVLHPIVTVSDMEAALHFYRDLLGLRVTFDEVHEPAVMEKLTGYHDPDVRAVIVAAGDGTEVELVEFRRPSGLPRVNRDWCDAGLSMLTFRVSDLTASIRELAANGIEFTSEPAIQVLPDRSTVRAAYCFGPDGVTICLGELPSGRRTIGGRDGRR